MDIDQRIKESLAQIDLYLEKNSLTSYDEYDAGTFASDVVYSLVDVVKILVEQNQLLQTKIDNHEH